MSKETVAQIGKAITEAQRAKSLRKQQEASKQQAETLKQEAEKQALIARNEARLRATGVVGLFEELRDSGTLKFEKGGPFEEHTTVNFLGIEWPVVKMRTVNDTPAIIQWEPDRLGISIEFDRHYTYEGQDWEDDTIAVYYPRKRLLEAKITEEGVLQIGQHKMKPGEELEDVVRDEILRLKGLRE